MQLPIDFRTRPIKRKYIDQETPMFADWMIFGEYEDGTVGIVDGDGPDIFTHVPRAVAERILKIRSAFTEALVAELDHP